ncbi:hypothetical protein CKO09_10500 [Chromatium weissei]|nr:hypothetical protein [Chromatium weissei]
MLEIKKADYICEYKINLFFNNDKSGQVNLKKLIFTDSRTVFSKLKNPDLFKNFRVANGTIVWSDEIDLAAEYLFYLAFEDESNLQEQFKEWGYIA